MRKEEEKASRGPAMPPKGLGPSGFTVEVPSIPFPQISTSFHSMSVCIFSQAAFVLSAMRQSP